MNKQIKKLGFAAGALLLLASCQKMSKPDMGTYPAGVPTDEERYIVGELYQIKHRNEFSWAMGQLDDYEGVNAEEEHERLYGRSVTEVIAGDMTLEAWIYWYHGDTSGRPVIESGDMLQYVHEKQ